VKHTISVVKCKTFYYKRVRPRRDFSILGRTTVSWIQAAAKDCGGGPKGWWPFIWEETPYWHSLRSDLQALLKPDVRLLPWSPHQLARNPFGRSRPFPLTVLSIQSYHDPLIKLIEMMMTSKLSLKYTCMGCARPLVTLSWCPKFCWAMQSWNNQHRLVTVAFRDIETSR